MKNAAPAIAIVVALLVPAHVAATDPPVHEIQIVAGRFAFDPSTIQVTAGESVRLVIRSKDTVHGFSVPKLKIDVRIPKGGEPVVVEFIAPPPGRFEIACSEFCGSGHGQMKAALISVAPVTTSR
jgi:cytochrome c oxidase subunit 2